MPKTYEQAPPDLHELVAKVMREHHPDLFGEGVTVDVLMEAQRNSEGDLLPSLKLRGYPCTATIKINGLKDRALEKADALMTVDACTWWRLDAAERAAVVDHELTHLQLVSDWVVNADGTGQDVARRDDLGRPKIKMRLHDWQLGGFAKVAERHGNKALEVQHFRATANEHGQFLLDLVEAPSLRAVG